MNPKRTQKKGKRLCACCGKTEDFDSNEVIFEYFGKEFTEYEYVIENLAIRPAPKKLLDLVPVHSTNISKKSVFKMPTMSNCAGEVLHKPTNSVMVSERKNRPNEYGDGRKAENPATKSHDPIKRQDVDDFISLKILPDEAEPRMCGPCNPMAVNYNPCSQYPYDQKPCGSCRVETFPEKCKPTDSKMVSNILNLRRTIKSKEYRTTKQILSDLCEASEQSLHIRSNSCKFADRPMPIEIQNTIETLRFKKPLPQFFTRTEKRPFHKPGVYFVTKDNALEESDNTNTKSETQRINDQMESAKLGVLDLGEPGLSVYELQSFYAETEQPRLSDQSGQQRVSGQSGQQRFSGQSAQQRLSGQSGQPRLSDQSGQPRLSGQSGQPRLSAQSGQPRIGSGQSEQKRIPGEFAQFRSGVELQRSDITIDDLSEHIYEDREDRVLKPGVDSVAQTDISKPCPCPKTRKNLKWKIIINKHSNCKC